MMADKELRRKYLFRVHHLGMWVNITVDKTDARHLKSGLDPLAVNEKCMRPRLSAVSQVPAVLRDWYARFLALLLLA